MNKIDLIDQQSGLEYNMESIHSFCDMILDKCGIDNWEFSVVFCNDEYISNLNSLYRKIEGPTDILTFCDEPDDWGGEPVNELSYAGDMAISVDSLKKNAEYFNVDEKTELKRLLIHGILHLNGMEHSTNEPEEEMLLLQENILKTLGDFEF